MCRVRNKLIPGNLPTLRRKHTNHPIGVFCYVLQILDAKKTHKFICEIYKHLWYKLSASHGTASFFFMKLRTLSQNKKTLSSIFLFKNLKKCKKSYINQKVRIKTFFAGILTIQTWIVKFSLFLGERKFALSSKSPKSSSVFSWKVFIFCVLISGI